MSFHLHSGLGTGPLLFSPIHMLEYSLGDSWDPEDILEPSQYRDFRDKFRSIYVVKGVWSSLTDLFLNRLWHM